MTPLKKRLDEKREKDALDFALCRGEFTKFFHAKDDPNPFKEGAAPRDEIIEMLAGCLDFHTGSCVTAEGQRTSAAHALAKLEKFLGEEK